MPTGATDATSRNWASTARSGEAVVPLLWPAGTVVCIGGGPSLTAADVAYVRGRVNGVIAINDAYRLAPWADVLYGCDAKWWYWHKGVPGFAGLKFSIDPVARRHRDVIVLRRGRDAGLETDRGALATGANSGFQAINLAVHLGATRILLLGYDMKGNHWFGSHPDHSKPPFAVCLSRFASLPPALAARGVTVVNCSRETALTAFPRVALEVALP